MPVGTNDSVRGAVSPNSLHPSIFRASTRCEASVSGVGYSEDGDGWSEQDFPCHGHVVVGVLVGPVAVGVVGRHEGGDVGAKQFHVRP
jgi:hypothetical protein